MRHGSWHYMYLAYESRDWFSFSGFSQKCLGVPWKQMKARHQSRHMSLNHDINRDMTATSIATSILPLFILVTSSLVWRFSSGFIILCFAPSVQSKFSECWFGDVSLLLLLSPLSIIWKILFLAESRLFISTHMFSSLPPFQIMFKISAFAINLAESFEACCRFSSLNNQFRCLSLKNGTGWKKSQSP